MNFPAIFRMQIKLDEQAKEIEALKTQIKHYQKCVCSTCDGHGFVGNAPDDYYNCPDCRKYVCRIEANGRASEINKLKSIMGREFGEKVESFLNLYLEKFKKESDYG